MLIKIKPTDFSKYTEYGRKNFVSEQMPGRHYKFPGFFACYPMTKEPGSFFRIHLLLLFR